MKQSKKEKEASYVCVECGVPYLSEKQIELGGFATTFHEGICDLCGKKKRITSVRHYNYLIKKPQ